MFLFLNIHFILSIASKGINIHKCIFNQSVMVAVKSINSYKFDTIPTKQFIYLDKVVCVCGKFEQLVNVAVSDIRPNLSLCTYHGNEMAFE